MGLTPDDDDTVPHEPKAAGLKVSVSDWGARSSIGLVRQANEDSWGQADATRFVVADGMGGAAGGARASSIAVAQYLATSESGGWLNAISAINQTVRQVCDSEGLMEAGTTLVGISIDGGRCTYMSVGDSRIYRLHNGELALITADHNIGNLRLESGLDPLVHDERGKPAALTSFLGNPDNEQRIDIGTVAIAPDDRLLLCSDGVHGQLDHERIAKTLELDSCTDAAAELVRASDAAGGRDNATAIAIEIGETCD